MAESSKTASRAPLDLPTAIERIRRRPTYVITALVMILMAVVGFVPRMIRPLLEGTIPPDWIIHVHVLVYWVWLGLFFTQTVNAAVGRLAVHKKLGKVLIGYGVLMWLAGMGVTVARIFRQLHAGEPWLAKGTNLEPMVDMIVFPVLFGLAVYYRRKPEIHKRLMIVTAAELMYPAAVRITQKPHSLVTLIIVAPVLVAMAYDWFTRRRIHPIYVAGFVLLAVLSYRMRWVESPAWLHFIDWCASLARAGT